MIVSTALVVSLASVLAGSLILASSFSGSSLFQVGRDENKIPQAEAAPLPVDIMERFNSKRMAGDAESGSRLKIDDQFIDPEQHCEFCTRVEYTPGPQGQAGFAYENSAGVDLTGAKKARFWVMGEDGGEKVKFKLAGKSLGKLADKISSKSIFKSEKFALSTDEVTLGKDWKKYEVDLKGVDLKGITAPFGIEFSKGAGKQVFYIKGIIYDTAPAENPLAATAEQVAEPLQAKIISNSTIDSAPATVEFKANVTGGVEPYSSINWDFGDGSEGQGSSVEHTFADAGEYNVTLTVSDSSDQSASDSVIVQVSEPEAVEGQDNETAPPANTSDAEIPEEQAADQNRNATGDSNVNEEQATIAGNNTEG